MQPAGQFTAWSATLSTMATKSSLRAVKSVSVTSMAAQLSPVRTAIVLHQRHARSARPSCPLLAHHSSAAAASPLCSVRALQSIMPRRFSEAASAAVNSQLDSLVWIRGVFGNKWGRVQPSVAGADHRAPSSERKLARLERRRRVGRHPRRQLAAAASSPSAWAVRCPLPRLMEIEFAKNGFNRTDRIVVARNGNVDQVGITVGIDQANGWDARGTCFTQRVGLAVDVIPSERQAFFPWCGCHRGCG